MDQCTTVGYTWCAGAGCLPSTRCCLAVGTGWMCTTGHVCSTITGTIDCVNPSPARIVAQTCNHSSTVCPNTDCFRCKDPLSPSCYPLIYTSASVVLRKWSCATTTKEVTIYPDAGGAPNGGSTATTSTTGVISNEPRITSPGPAKETSPPAAQQPSPPAAGSGMSAGETAGIVLGTFAVLVLSAILYVVLRRRKVVVPATPEYEAGDQGPYVPELALQPVPVSKAPGRSELM